MLNAEFALSFEALHPYTNVPNVADAQSKALGLYGRAVAVVCVPEAEETMEEKRRETHGNTLKGGAGGAHHRTLLGDGDGETKNNAINGINGNSGVTNGNNDSSREALLYSSNGTDVPIVGCYWPSTGEREIFLEPIKDELRRLAVRRGGEKREKIIEESERRPESVETTRRGEMKNIEILSRCLQWRNKEGAAEKVGGSCWR